MPLRNGDEPHLERGEPHPDGEDTHLEGEGPIWMGTSPIGMATIPFGKGESPIWRGTAGNTGRKGLEGGEYDPSLSMTNDPLRGAAAPEKARRAHLSLQDSSRTAAVF